MPKNLYYVIGAKATTEAEAIAEAHRIAEHFASGPGDIVSVRECGTQRIVANVFPDGNIGVPTAAQRAATNN